MNEGVESLRPKIPPEVKNAFGDFIKHDRRKGIKIETDPDRLISAIKYVDVKRVDISSYGYRLDDNSQYAFTPNTSATFFYNEDNSLFEPHEIQKYIESDRLPYGQLSFIIRFQNGKLNCIWINEENDVLHFNYNETGNLYEVSFHPLDLPDEPKNSFYLGERFPINGKENLEEFQSSGELIIKLCSANAEFCFTRTNDDRTELVYSKDGKKQSTISFNETLQRQEIKEELFTDAFLKDPANALNFDYLMDWKFKDLSQVAKVKWDKR
jgi:hypothetical protein